MTVTAQKYLSEIESYIPGKSKISTNKNAIKLSSNENALKASPKAIEAYTNYNREISRYADGSCNLLRQGLAERNNIESENIVCGAGSDEIIALLTAAFAGVGDEVIYSEHGFLMYPISAKRVGAKAVVAKEINLKTDVGAVLSAITDKTRVIFIANPNNPTGSYLNQGEIEALITNTPKHILIVLDHAYDEFAEMADYPNALELVKKYPNVVVTRTFSKIYGLASLRIGWCYSSPYVAEILNKIRGPFNVSGAAQAAAEAALTDEEFLQKSKSHNKKWLKIFFEELEKNQKIVAHPSITNFILLDFGSEESCQKANEKLLEAGIILREMTAYKLPNCLRATIGTDEENTKLLNILNNEL
jgi:histidinol-phosphate aminotransferase